MQAWLAKNALVLVFGILIGVTGINAINGAFGALFNWTGLSDKARLEKTREKLGVCQVREAGLEGRLEENRLMVDRHIQAQVDQSKEAAAAYSDGAERWGAQCKQAYASGVIAGRAAGRGEARAPVAKRNPGDLPVAPGGVRNDGPSFRSTWADGAFTAPP